MLFFLFFLHVITAIDYSLIIDEKTSIDRSIFQFTHGHELIQNFHSNFHLVNNNRDLMLINPIDRDVWCTQNICSCDNCSFQLEFISFEDKTISTMNITINDVNDHSCQFLDIQENISLSESIQIGHRFPIARAIDYDSHLNGQLTFQLLNHQDYFQLNIINLSINEYAIYGVVQRSLDRESTEQYELIIEGKDHGLPESRANRTKVTIWIVDENDNAPKFNQSEYSILSIAEDTPIGTELLTIFATDADKGSNGLIHYSIIVPTGQSSFPFAINSSTGVVSLQYALDYETIRSYRFLIRASDSGLPQSLFTDSWLSISIKDVNDCPVRITFFPNQRFRYNNQTLFIYENTEIDNLTLGSFRLFDPDSIVSKLSLSLLPIELESRQDYELISSNQANTYLLIVKHGIYDREIQSNIQLHLIASDTLLTSTFNLKIHLIDLNDNPSEFSSNPVKFYVEELANYRMVENPIENYQLTIGYLNATDRDEGENALSRYEIESNVLVKIDSDTGRLYLTQPLDREQMTIINLKGKAINLVEPKWITEIQIQIDVIDVNDHLPHCFSSFERIIIPENISIEQSLLMINASDPDQGVNGTIHYSIHSNDSWPFEVNSRTGEIYSRRMFDYESKFKSFFIEIDLEDQGFPIQNRNKNACRIEIQIEDINDNSPELINPGQSEIFIDRNMVTPAEILTFDVKDFDDGDNGKIKFILQTEDQYLSSLFFINKNGTLILNYSVKEISLFTLKLILEDYGQPSQQTIINLTIAVGDSSDPLLARFDQVLLKYSRSNNIGLIFGLTILMITIVLFICIVFTCFLLRRHRRRHQAAIMARKKLLCTSAQQLTSSGSTTTTNTGSSGSVDHQILSHIVQPNSKIWHDHFYDQQSSQSYNVDSSSPESRTYKIIHVPQDNEHYFRYFQQEKIDNQSSDLGYHGSYETGSSSSPSQVSIPRSYMTNHLPDFVTKCKTVSEGFLVEMNVDGSDEDAK